MKNVNLPSLSVHDFTSLLQKAYSQIRLTKQNRERIEMGVSTTKKGRHKDDRFGVFHEGRVMVQ